MTGSVIETGTVLDRILARTAADVAVRKTTTRQSDLERRASDRERPLSLKAALTPFGVQVIAEIKRASPSRGVFPVEVDPAAVARQYLDGGAAALSVLTDEPFFQGSLADLTAASTVAHHRRVPVLRKDFVVDEYQLFEALAIGADAVLLIVAAIDQTLLIGLLEKAKTLGLSVLVEVHDEEEMGRAKSAGSEIIGINNRDLHTFEVDHSTTERLAPLAVGEAVVVAESGIITRDDIERLARVDVDAVLVGESLIVSDDRVSAIRRLRGMDGSS